ncbi:hypothetical protein G7Z17_g2886 [Cylindrodendrum hubeiense]|uniref:Zn(2)-C6 fungal-type domain-containing protein n=1 Tax=Cylindrodendrum hubeiense TaxID=595255 RepID=A0A9P5LIN1_9HYPO|nr:hypothetical protein G7Z17_g2886 [Cylindrodendrum hubeiense]
MAENLIPPACTKCRIHRVKCDKVQPICGRCGRLGHPCEYPFRNPAAAYLSYATDLEEEIAQLEVELEHLNAVDQGIQYPPDSTDSPQMVKAADTDDNTPSKEAVRYLGASSGMAFIESAISLAQSRGILNAPEEELLPLEPLKIISPGLLEGLVDPRPSLTIPSRDTMRQLFNEFVSAQWQYRIIEPDEFDVYLDRYYGGGDSPDMIATAAVHLVLATTLHLSGKSEGNVAASNLAAAHHEKAMGMLGSINQYKTLESLQVMLLLLLLSMFNPQKPVAWHLLGSAIRTATAMRLHTEEGITMTAYSFDVSEDLPRRLFWTLYSMDRAVGNTLGRPTALQDSSITCQLPGAASSNIPLPQRIANHCFLLRRLQSEVADTLYQRTSEYAIDYIPSVQARLDMWFQDIPTHDSDHVVEWFHHSYYNLCMFIHRPSPANPKPTSDHLHRCFQASSRVIEIYHRLDQRGSIDTTWMAVHWLFLAAVTQLFSLWTDENLRREADWVRINDDTQACTMIFSAMTERWKSGRRMLKLYRRLSKGTLARYTQMSYVDTKTPAQGSDNQSEDFMDMPDISGLNEVVLDSDMQFWLNMEIADSPGNYPSFGLQDRSAFL